MCSGEPIGLAADCWGIGTLLLEMLTLQDILHGQDTVQSRELLPKLDALEGLTRPEVELLAGLLDVDPSLRLTASGAIGLPYFDECSIKGILMPPRKILKARRTVAKT